MSAANTSLAQRAKAYVGRQLKDKWRLDRLLGAGGVAMVYAATHRNRSRAAVKILYPELADDPRIRERFLHEGYAANSVGHPGAVQVLDDDQTDDGLVFLVMELLEGENLAVRAERLGGKLPAASVLPIADAVLDVLAAAHDKHIVHRDLKPENIFLTTSGGVKVLDFGLARLRERMADGSGSNTQIGWTMGTPGFMPPEQARGQWDRVDARSDLWALGATMFVLISGRPVYEAEDSHVRVLLAATRPAPSLATVAPGLPPDVVEFVDRALAADPAARWQSATAMRAALAEVLRAHGDDPSWAREAPRASTQIPMSRAMAPTLTESESRESSASRESAALVPASRIVADSVSPIEIAPDTYWVGKRDPKSIFHVNPYLRVFRDGQGAPYNLLIDPGSSSDFAVVSAKVTALIGGMSKLNGLFVNHQDPDVGSSSSVISARYAPGASIICSEATWRLIVHFNLPRERFVNTDDHLRGLTLPNGQVVLPVPSPFCHFRGAVMLYDPMTRVLFSGDLLGGITTPGASGIWADESDWSGVRAFHQTYMPTNRVLVSAARAIRRLVPKVEIIAPQHGRILCGPFIERFLERLERLPVGLDIIDEVGEGPDVMAAWSSVLRRVLHTAEVVLGTEPEALLLQNDELRETLVHNGSHVAVGSAGRWTIGAVVHLLTTGQPPSIANPIKLEALFACEELELPSPDLGLEAEEGGPARTGLGSVL